MLRVARVLAAFWQYQPVSCAVKGDMEMYLSHVDVSEM